MNKTQYDNTEGYDLFEITKNEWILNVRGGNLYVGTFKKVVLQAVKNMGFELSEIECAAKQMIEKGHNSAHFGMYKGFIFTFQKEFSHDKKAG